MQKAARELNEELARLAPDVLAVLSSKGKRMYFPKSGILAQAAEAKGAGINATIGIGLEDDGTPMRLPALFERLPLDPVETLPYVNSFGKPELRRKWREMIMNKNPSISSDISMPVVTHALTHGLSIAAQMFCDPGERIVLPDKFWGNYTLMFQEVLDVGLEVYNTFDEGGFDVRALEHALAQTGGKKTLLFNFPNNPTGYAPTTEEVNDIVGVIRHRAMMGDYLTVIIDDAYFGLTYEDNVSSESLFARLCDAHERVIAVKVDGATKEDYAWGLRVGFLTFGWKGGSPQAYEVLEDKVAGFVRGTVSNVAHPSQSLLLHLYDHPEYRAQKRQKFGMMKKRYEAMKRDVSRPEYREWFTPLPFNAGYMMSVELRDGLDAEQVRRTLLHERGVGVVANGNLIRIAYSCLPVDRIDMLLRELVDVCKHSLSVPVSSHASS